MSEALPTLKPYRASSLFHKQLPHAKKMFADAGGWIRAENFEDPDQERKKVESGIGLADVSFLDKAIVKGKDALNFLTLEMFGDKKAEISQVVEFNPETVDFGLCCILASDELFVLAESGTLVTFKTKLQGDCMHSTDVTSYYAGVYLLGPKSPSLVSKLTELDIRQKHFGNLSVQYAEVFHVQSILLRLDLKDVRGYMFFFDRGFGDYLWDRIMYAGKEFETSLIGSTTLNNLDWKGG
jgi:sarcosine oxidase subunit alpha